VFAASAKIDPIVHRHCLHALFRDSSNCTRARSI